MTCDMTRRSFLGAAALAAGCSPRAEQPPDGAPAAEPILDLHLHARHLGRTHQQLVAHQKALAVTQSVFLPGAGWLLERIGGNDECAQLVAADEASFLWFANADPAMPDAVETLSNWCDRGAIGIGEQKFKLPLDSPEMRGIFDLAKERNLPVLIHFEHGNYNLGIENLPKILEDYPEVTFIGHAQSWWGNIGAGLDPADMYPAGPVSLGGLTDRVLADYPNMYGDLAAGSGLNAITRDEDFTRGFLDRHQDKLIWGTDCPCHDGRGGGRKDGKCIGASSLAALERLAPSQEVFRKIVYGNAARVLDLRAG